MLGTHDPALLEAYDGFYEALTLHRRSLSDRERVVVWAALLVALCAGAFGVGLAKLLATSVSTLMQRKRSRGESLSWPHQV